MNAIQLPLDDIGDDDGDEEYHMKLKEELRNYSDVIKKNSSPRVPLTMQLIRQQVSSLHCNLDDLAKSLVEIQILHLDYLNIAAIENLEVFTNLQELYLQNNHIERIENLEFHTKLEFLALSYNKINQITNIRHLGELKVLDVSHNQIEELALDELPKSLQVLNLDGNPCCQNPQLAKMIIQQLPFLTHLNGFQVNDPIFCEIKGIPSKSLLTIEDTRKETMLEANNNMYNNMHNNNKSIHDDEDPVSFSSDVLEKDDKKSSLMENERKVLIEQSIDRMEEESRRSIENAKFQMTLARERILKSAQERTDYEIHESQKRMNESKVHYTTWVQRSFNEKKQASQ